MTSERPSFPYRSKFVCELPDKVSYLVQRHLFDHIHDQQIKQSIKVRVS